MMDPYRFSCQTSLLQKVGSFHGASCTETPARPTMSLVFHSGNSALIKNIEGWSILWSLFQTRNIILASLTFSLQSTASGSEPCEWNLVAAFLDSLPRMNPPLSTYPWNSSTVKSANLLTPKVKVWRPSEANLLWLSMYLRLSSKTLRLWITCNNRESRIRNE